MTPQEALEQLKRYGYSADSFLTLGEFERFTAHVKGYVAVHRTRGLCVAISDPVCDPADTMELVHALRKDCEARKQRLAFVSVTPRAQHALDLMGFGSIKTAEKGIFDLKEYTFEGSDKREVRQHASKAEREGVIVRNVEDRDAEAVDALLEEWLGTRKTEGFSLTLGFSEAFNDERRVLVAEHEGRIVGYLACTPIYARNGWYFEDLIRGQDAPRGTNHLLVREAIRIFRDEGYEMATLGSAPLGRIREGETDERRLINRSLEFAYEHFNAFYNFKGLAGFKASFSPSSWESQYLCYWPPRLTPGVLVGIVELSLPGGITKAVRDKLFDTLKAVPRSAGKGLGRIGRSVRRTIGK